jgi:hypothetical protein
MSTHLGAWMIFVSIAGYRDPELQLTVDSLIENADKPKELHLSIVQQCLAKEHIWFESQGLPCKITNLWIDAKKARGAGHARSIAQMPYNEEDYYFQIDSHTRVSSSWDTDLKGILIASQELAGTDKVILSQFPAPYVKGSKNSDIFMKDHPKYTHLPTKQEILWAQRRSWSAKRVPLEGNVPEESTTVLAGFLFAPGYIVKEIPYDPEISFFGEELCFSIRAWTRDWKIYSPHIMVVFHYYKRQGEHKIWDARNNANKKWGKIEKTSMLKQARVYSGQNLGVFGARSGSKFSDYEVFAGVEIRKLYNQMLMTRHTMSDEWLEQDLIITDEGLGTERLSIPCIDGEHENTEIPCAVEGCECKCHG